MPNSEILFDSDSISWRKRESGVGKAAKSNRYANKYIHISLHSIEITSQYIQMRIRIDIQME